MHSKERHIKVYDTKDAVPKGLMHEGGWAVRGQQHDFGGHKAAHRVSKEDDVRVGVGVRGEPGVQSVVWHTKASASRGATDHLLNCSVAYSIVFLARYLG